MRFSPNYLCGVPGVGRFAFLVLAILSVGCGETSSPAGGGAGGSAQGPAASDGGDAVVAVVGGREIQESELEALVQGAVIQAKMEVFTAKQGGLQQIVQETLLEIEAEAEGVSPEELIAREVDSKVSQPSDQEVRAFYEVNKERIQQSFEEIAPQIVGHLENQQRQAAFSEFLEGLSEKHGVETFLEPVRIPMEADGFPAKGPADAPVVVVEFSDFECPYCSRVVPTLDRLVESYGEELRLVFRQFPLSGIHPNAQKAAEASLCAFDQDKFWDMHDLLFREQCSLGVEQLKEKAVRLGLDGETFNECLDSGRHGDAVAEDLRAGGAAGVTGTPAMFINGQFISGAQPYEAVAALVDAELERLAR